MFDSVKGWRPCGYLLCPLLVGEKNVFSEFQLEICRVLNPKYEQGDTVYVLSF